MAEPIPFKRANVEYQPPRGDHGTTCTLPVFRGADTDGRPVLISKWRLTNAEIEEVRRTGVVWVWVLGEAQPPVSIGVGDPFAEVGAR